MIIYIITLLFSITSIFISLYLFLDKEKLRNTPHELCADLEGDEFNTCIKKMTCVQNINCNLQGQPANRGMTSSNVDIGTFGDCSIIGNC
tara:strand:+ start:234 stop:503 length:270 start_codon:yes stop_codon:yes gene_type:complete